MITGSKRMGTHTEAAAARVRRARQRPAAQHFPLSPDEIGADGGGTWLCHAGKAHN
jgi:hypothetical protein